MFFVLLKPQAFNYVHSQIYAGQLNCWIDSNPKTASYQYLITNLLSGSLKLQSRDPTHDLAGYERSMTCC